MIKQTYIRFLELGIRHILWGGDGGGGRGYENLCPEFVGVRIVLYDLGGGRNLLCPFKIKFCLCISIQRPD